MGAARVCSSSHSIACEPSGGGNRSQGGPGSEPWTLQQFSQDGEEEAAGKAPEPQLQCSCVMPCFCVPLYVSLCFQVSWVLLLSVSPHKDLLDSVLASNTKARMEELVSADSRCLWCCIVQSRSLPFSVSRTTGRWLASHPAGAGAASASARRWAAW